MLSAKLEEFISVMINEEKSRNTISSYQNDINQFISFVGNREITKAIVIEYKKEISNLKPSSMNRKLIVINKFIVFIGINDSKVKVNKVQKKQFIEDVLTVDEVQTIIDSAREYKDYRGAAILTTLAHTGLRVSELLGLSLDDADQETITVMGKGEKPRDILLSDKVREALKEYIEHERSKHVNPREKALFVGQRGAMTRARVDTIIKDYCKSNDIDIKKAHAHTFRHYTALRLVDNGLDIGSIADVLGHSQITTTAIYTKRSKEQIKNIMNMI